MRTLGKTIIGISLLTLPACNQQNQSSAKFCERPQAMVPDKPPADYGEQILVVDACIHTWSYRLSSAPGSSREIADAVISGCEGQILHYTGMKERELKIEAGSERDADLAYFRGQAIFRVTQARAGHCSVP